jgi:hypothetical protein
MRKPDPIIHPQAPALHVLRGVLDSLAPPVLMALLGKKLVDLNLSAPHRDLFLGVLQADQLLDTLLCPVEDLLGLGGQHRPRQPAVPDQIGCHNAHLG